jgi:hypothetical protein
VSARAAISSALAALAGIPFGGCSALGAPAAPSGPAASVARAQTTHEYPAPTPPSERAADGAPTAPEAIRRFAGAYINWTAQTVAADMRTLAAECVGQARAGLALAAAQTANDYELRRAGISNSGSVEAVAPLPGARGRYVVVTREQTSATGTTAYQGLRPAWHLAIATVVSMARGRWLLSGWQPES